jgi:hypothetical protein
MVMKAYKIYSLLAICLFITEAKAQKAVQKDLTIEATLNLQVGGAPINFQISEIRMRYFLKNNIAVRTKFAFGYSNSTDYVYNVINPTIPPFTLKSKSSNFNVALGLEKHFAGTDKLSPYFGGEVGFGLNSNSLNGINTENGQQYLEGGTFTAQSVGGNSFYTGLVFGVDYYFIPSIYIGAELGYGFAIRNYGTRQIWNSNSAVVVENSLGSGMGFGLEANPGIRIGIKF